MAEFRNRSVDGGDAHICRCRFHHFYRAALEMWIQIMGQDPCQAGEIKVRQILCLMLPFLNQEQSRVVHDIKSRS